MKNIERRSFIKTSAIGSLAMVSPGLLSCVNAEKPHIRNIAGEKSVVSLIKGKDLMKMTREAIEAIGGMKSIIDEGDRVFIKPNFVNFPWAQYNNCFRNGECTKPEIIIATTEACLEAGAREVIIGEGSHLPTFDWKWAITLDGKTDLIEARDQFEKKYKGKVWLACLEEDSPGWTEIPSQTRHSNIAISSLVTDADKVISLPVAKTHSWAQLTLGTKNFLGITPLSRYAQWVDNSWWNRGSFDHSSPRAISQVFLDIVDAIRPALTVVDFSIGIEGNGPTMDNGGRPVNIEDHLGSWALVASKDIMAADATSARLMGHNIQRVKQLTMGHEMGLGQIYNEAIEYKGENIENLRMGWKHARLKG